MVFFNGPAGIGQFNLLGYDVSLFEINFNHSKEDIFVTIISEHEMLHTW